MESQGPVSPEVKLNNDKFIEGKSIKIKNTFGKLPNVKIELTGVTKGPDGRFTPHR